MKTIRDLVYEKYIEVVEQIEGMPTKDQKDKETLLNIMLEVISILDRATSLAVDDPDRVKE